LLAVQSENFWIHPHISRKCDTHADEEPKDKKTRKGLSLLQKVEVLNKFYRGMCTAVVGCHYDKLISSRRMKTRSGEAEAVGLVLR
jgi:hypothetical protein